MAVNWIVFGCVFSTGMVGMLLSAILPQRHLTAETENVVKLATGPVATMAALVFGVLIASAQDFRETRAGELPAMAVKLVLLDRLLAHYGPESKESVMCS
jgi:hypothetical protein